MQIVYRNIRFSAKVDRCLRQRWRMHGDLSIRVREALNAWMLCEHACEQRRLGGFRCAEVGSAGSA
jgi:hypothetical protein